MVQSTNSVYILDITDVKNTKISYKYGLDNGKIYYFNYYESIKLILLLNSPNFLIGLELKYDNLLKTYQIVKVGSLNT
jgi:hypothetical protein